MLVRHGQASFGAEDYDRLSELGHSQGCRLGAALAGRGFVPSRVISGSLRRQRHTANAVLEGAGWDPPVTVDPGWNEFDHLGVVTAYAPLPGAVDSRRFQGALDRAMAMWAASGAVAGVEAFADFTLRTRAALERLVGSLGRGEDALVVSSAGVISWLTTALIGGGVDQWIKLNRVSVNTGTTKVVVGRSGVSVVTFNDHSHLDRGLMSYR